MIYLIDTLNEDLYYAVDNGKIYCGSTGSEYIKDFVEDVNLEYEYLEIHPDIVYVENGCHIGMSNIKPDEFKTFDKLPKWFYCYDPDEPLLKQLSEEEFSEFVALDCRPFIRLSGDRGVEKFNKQWYIENGFR